LPPRKTTDFTACIIETETYNSNPRSKMNPKKKQKLIVAAIGLGMTMMTFPIIITLIVMYVAWQMLDPKK